MHDDEEEWSDANSGLQWKQQRNSEIEPRCDSPRRRHLGRPALLLGASVSHLIAA